MGRRPAIPASMRAYIRRQKEQGASLAEIAAEVGASKSAVHRSLSAPPETLEPAPPVPSPPPDPATLEGPPTPRPAKPAQTLSAGWPVPDPRLDAREAEARRRGALEAARALARWRNPYPLPDNEVPHPRDLGLPGWRGYGM